MKTPYSTNSNSIYKKFSRSAMFAIVVVAVVLYCFSLQSCNKTTTFEREFTIVVLDSITHEPLQGICVQFYQNDGYSTYELGARKSYESDRFLTDENGKVVHSFNPFKNRRDPFIELRIGTTKTDCYSDVLLYYMI